VRFDFNPYSDSLFNNLSAFTEIIMFGKYEMKDFKSNEEFFSAPCDLIERIEKQGNCNTERVASMWNPPSPL
jgi:hypothetical protein